MIVGVSPTIALWLWCQNRYLALRFSIVARRLRLLSSENTSSGNPVGPTAREIGRRPSASLPPPSLPLPAVRKARGRPAA